MFIADEMLRAPHHPALGETDVHVWCASVKQSQELVEQLSVILSRDERERAARFHFEHLRHAFIVARGLLRIILADYLGLAPAQLEFTYGPAGKPKLAERLGNRIHFNLSHSQELVLFAVSASRSLGIDIECIRPLQDLEQIAERTFSPREIKDLKTLPPDAKQQAFFHGWTRKEAYIKAIGDGISYPLHQFDVSLKPNEPAKLLRIQGSEQKAACWSLFNLEPAPGYAAALVVEGDQCVVTCSNWQPGSSQEGQ